MQYRVGDTIFSYAGSPALVRDRKAETSEYVVAPKGETYAEIQKRGYVNGLTPDLRQDFNAVMDRIRAIAEPEKKVAELAVRIEERRGGDARARLVAKYLDAEMQHIMATSNITNRYYTLDALKVSD